MKTTRHLHFRRWAHAAVLGLGLVTGCTHTPATTASRTPSDDRARARAWLEENYSALRAGELTLEDLP